MKNEFHRAIHALSMSQFELGALELRNELLIVQFDLKFSHPHKKEKKGETNTSTEG